MGRKRIVIGATGASGLPVTVECLKILREDPAFSSCLILSDSAKVTLRQETDLTEEDLFSLADQVFDLRDIGAGPASGTWKTAGMLVVPCSMKTLAGIHSGYADSLLLRAADVTLKEQRPLVLAVRETPLSPIHLRNMQELSMIPGVRIVPPMLTYYIRPKSIEEMTYHTAAKLLEPFGVETPDYKRWQGL
ncbi:MAG: UbiX family flavin prenyltransferase [Stomatobaculum sp.]|nr:UbiX family flavin prenyltransferase [Stomatobaculum sp.]